MRGCEERRAVAERPAPDSGGAGGVVDAAGATGGRASQVHATCSLVTFFVSICFKGENWRPPGS